MEVSGTEITNERIIGASGHQALACQLLSDIPEGFRTVSDTAPFLLHSDTVATAPKKGVDIGSVPIGILIQWPSSLSCLTARQGLLLGCIRYSPPLVDLLVNRGRSIGRQAPTMPKEDSIIAQYTNGLL